MHDDVRADPAEWTGRGQRAVGIGADGHRDYRDYWGHCCFVRLAGLSHVVKRVICKPPRGGGRGMVFVESREDVVVEGMFSGNGAKRRKEMGRDVCYLAAAAWVCGLLNCLIRRGCCIKYVSMCVHDDDEVCSNGKSDDVPTFPSCPARGIPAGQD